MQKPDPAGDAAPARTAAVDRSLPVVDISALRDPGSPGAADVVAAIRAACLDKGFFYCIGHGIDRALVNETFAAAVGLFDLPIDAKMRLDKARSTANRGYEPMGNQTLEPGTPPDLKEGYYIGIHIDAGDERAGRHFNAGPNVWPDGLAGFQEVMLRYFAAMLELSGVLLGGIARSLGLDVNYFAEFRREPLATLRLLHYPPQSADPLPGEKGCGAHTDFGAITILLQDDVGGLQVWDHETEDWIDGTPLPDSFVVNFGDMIGRWTNGRYRSTIHRVINVSGRERYSVPFFFSGNPDYLIEPIMAGPEDGALGSTPAITVDAHMRQRYADTYDHTPR